MKNLELYLILILPPILCAFLFSVTDISLDYLPLSFGLIIGFINWKAHKFKPLLGVLLSVLISYISFFIALFSSFIFGYIREFIMGMTNFVISDTTIRNFSLIITSFIFAPLLVFFFYKYIFYMPKTKLSLIIKITTVIILVLISCIFINIEQMDISNSFFLWQIIMALAVQIIIYQKQLFKSNNI